MTLRTYKVELRIDFDHDGNEEKKQEIIKAAMRQTCREVFATAQLLTAGSKRKPTIAFHGGDFFEKDEQIEIAGADFDEINAQAEAVAANPGTVKFFKVEAVGHPEVFEYFEAPDVEHAKEQFKAKSVLVEIPEELLAWCEVAEIPPA